MANDEQRHTFKQAAKLIGWNVKTFRRRFMDWLRQTEKDEEAIKEILKLIDVPHGPQTNSMPLAKLAEFRQSLGGNKRQDGYATTRELAQAIGADRDQAGTVIEVYQCADRWYAMEKLPGEKAVVEKETKARSDSGSKYRIVEPMMTYHKAKFLELWSVTYSVKVGAAYLKERLPYGTAVLTATVDQEMKDKGFVGRRLDAAKQLAGVTCRLPKDGKSKDKHFSERIDPKRPQARSPTAILDELVSKGPTATTRSVECFREALERGVRPDAVRRALRDLNITSYQVLGDGFFLCREGQTLPTPGEVPHKGTGGTGPATAARGESDNVAAVKTKGKAINGRMLAKIQEDQERKLWSSTKWANVLNCSHGTVKGTETWKAMCVPAREAARLARGGRRLRTRSPGFRH